MELRLAERSATKACTASPKAKNKRISAPKVKTGCRACKACHTKCDEQKPMCGRCSRRGIPCIYPLLYSRKNGLWQQQELRQRPLKQILPAGRLSEPPCLRQPTPFFLTPDEALYFDKFRFSAVFNLASSNSEFWHGTVLRESTHDECVRSALVALGALARAMDLQFDDTAPRGSSGLPLQNTQLGSIASRASIGNHYYQALSHYTNALGVFRRRLARPRQDTPRAMLIATILLTSFEYLQGNMKSADQISAYTLNMLRDTIMQGRFGAAGEHHTSMIAAPTDDAGVEEAETVLVRNTIFNAAFSPLYVHARDAILRLPVPSFRKPRPPGPEASCDVFARLCVEYLTLVSVWHYRVLTTMPAATPTYDDADVGGRHDSSAGHASSTAKAWWAKRLRQRADVIALLAEWLAAFDQRLSVPDLSPLDRFIYQRHAVAVKTCYHTVCAILDTSGSSSSSSSSSDAFDAAAAEILTETEAVFLASVAGPENDFNPKLARATPPPSSSSMRPSWRSDGRGRGSSHSPAAQRMQDQALAAGGALIGVGTIAHGTRSTKLRRRAMEQYARMVTSASHWDIQATYLGPKALFDVEEEEAAAAAAAAAAGDLITEETSSPTPQGQWFWVGGRWNDDYTEFLVVLASKAVGMDGTPLTRLVTMPAVSDEMYSL